MGCTINGLVHCTIQFPKVIDSASKTGPKRELGDMGGNFVSSHFFIIKGRRMVGKNYINLKEEGFRIQDA